MTFKFKHDLSSSAFIANALKYLSLRQFGVQRALSSNLHSCDIHQRIKVGSYGLLVGFVQPEHK